jgi:urea transport system permease protein
VLLLPFVEKNPDGSFKEADADLRTGRAGGDRAIDARGRTSALAGSVFYGISLGSILLLAALGLAITYG